MAASINLPATLPVLHNAFSFFKKHFIVILSLGLVASFGRVIQLGGFGKVSGSINTVLEVVIECARVVLFLYVLGLASIKKGVLRLYRLVSNKQDRKTAWSTAVRQLKKQWSMLILNLVVFLVIATAINYLIDLLAYETCLLLTLKKDGILAGTASEWTILLFFKNLSVIPLMLIFDAVLLLWVTNKVQPPLKLE